MGIVLLVESTKVGFIKVTTLLMVKGANQNCEGSEQLILFKKNLFSLN